MTTQSIVSTTRLISFVNWRSRSSRLQPDDGPFVKECCLRENSPMIPTFTSASAAMPSATVQSVAKLKLNVFPGGFNWPSFVAQNKGFFAVNGLEVTLQATTNSAAPDDWTGQWRVRYCHDSGGQYRRLCRRTGRSPDRTAAGFLCVHGQRQWFFEPGDAAGDQALQRPKRNTLLSAPSIFWPRSKDLIGSRVRPA